VKLGVAGVLTLTTLTPTAAGEPSTTCGWPFTPGIDADTPTVNGDIPAPATPDNDTLATPDESVKTGDDGTPDNPAKSAEKLTGTPATGRPAASDTTTLATTDELDDPHPPTDTTTCDDDNDNRANNTDGDEVGVADEDGVADEVGVEVGVGDGVAVEVGVEVGVGVGGAACTITTV